MASEFETGDLIAFRKGDRRGQIGVVSRPIKGDSEGHVLTVEDGALVGVMVSAQEVDAAGEGTAGYAQLAYNLNKLTSKVIEQKLLVFGPDR